VPRSYRLFKLTTPSDTWASLIDSASTTLEYTIADFAVSQFAKNLGEGATAKEFYSHADHWRNIFDLGSRSIRPRYRSGSWLKKFDLSSPRGFAEGNSAQYTWMIPFALRELISAMGGEAAAQSRLDEHLQKLNGWQNSPYLWIGNEPAFGVPWIYHWTGAPHRTQQVLSRIMKESFSDQAGGLPGNDDLGATSSWFVWTAMGLYPALPGVGGFVISKPLFSHTELTLGSGRTVQLLNSESSSEKNFIQTMTFNQNSWSRSWISWSELEKGGEIRFELGSDFSRWGTQASDLPPSYGDFAPR
jgi:predicted alpha-1,2-mannosidase